jgi:hypothetical protein
MRATPFPGVRLSGEQLAACPDGQAREASAPHSLLRRMLSVLNEGGIASTAAVARRLGVSQGLVVVMAAEMTRRGYLARISGCQGGCGGCHAASVCAPSSPAGTMSPTREATPGEMLMLTPKGRQAAAAQS